MRVWASKSKSSAASSGVAGGGVIKGLKKTHPNSGASASSSLPLPLPLSPTTRKRSSGSGSGSSHSKVLDPLPSPLTLTPGTGHVRYPVPIPVERATTRAGLLLSALASQSIVLKGKTEGQKRGRALTAKRYMMIHLPL